jgi:hypothetical protein
MDTGEQEEFYVGYSPKAPAGIARRARAAVIAIVIGAAVLAVLLTLGQRRFAASFFEFGAPRDFEGVINEYPVPTLMVQEDGQKDGKAATSPAFSYYALVSEGKHGAEALVEGFDGQRVKLRGTLIHRDDTAMIEVVRDSIKPARGGFNRANRPVENLGEQTLVGEIVDSKCYLGVMNPGHTKPHRECASLCIRGGVPPMFVVRDAEGKSAALWLVSEKGQPVNQQVLDFVAEPLEITGTVSRNGDQLFLRADPAKFRRI